MTAPRTAALLLAAASIAGGCGGGKDATRIVVATDATYPPFESMSTGGSVVGFDADLVRAAGREAGLTVELINQPFFGILPGLRQGKYDAVVSCLTITEERAREVDFTDPYFDAGQVVAVRAAEKAIGGLEDLKGRTIAVQQGTTGQDAAAKVGGATIKKFDTIDYAFSELLAGRADAVINDYPTTFLYMKEHPAIRIAGKPFTEEKYGIAVAKGNAALLAKLNEGLRKVRASGEYDRLKTQWIGDGGR